MDKEEFIDKAIDIAKNGAFGGCNEAFYEKEFEALLSMKYLVPDDNIQNTAHSWICERCGESVNNASVTFEETHDGCGGRCH